MSLPDQIFKPLRVLVACEESQAVSKAFRARGHEAYSNDLEPCSGGHTEWHLQMDCFEAIALGGWDMMIAFPPCTYLCNSGVRWMKGNPERLQQRESARQFVIRLFSAPIERIAIENPIGHLSTNWKKPNQIIQPYHFGHPEWKSTCLWLKNLPKLISTNPVQPNERRSGAKNRISSELHWLSPSKDRQKLRSKTYIGIAEAMAAQWSGEQQEELFISSHKSERA